MTLTRVTNAQLKDVITPQQFGAIGDGVADDTAAIQAAVDAAKSLATGAIIVGTLGKTYLISSTITVAADDIKFDMQGASVQTSGDIVAFEFGEPAGSSANTWKRNGIQNCTFIGSGSGNSNNRALAVRNHSYGSFTNNYYTNFGAKPILVEAYGRGNQYNDFRNSEIKDNHDGAIILDSGTTAGGYVNDNLFDNVRAHENPLSGGTRSQLVLAGTGTELVGNRFNNSSFESQIDGDTILEIQNGSENLFWGTRFDGTSITTALDISSGCNGNVFMFQGVQGVIVDDSGTSVAIGDRGADDLPYFQIGSAANPAVGSPSVQAFSINVAQPGANRELHIKPFISGGAVRIPDGGEMWFGDRDGGENAPIEIDAVNKQIDLQTLPSVAAGSGPKVRWRGQFTGSGDIGNNELYQDANGQVFQFNTAGRMLHSTQAMSVAVGGSEPAAVSGRAIYYGYNNAGTHEFKVVFPNGTRKVLANDT